MINSNCQFDDRFINLRMNALRFFSPKFACAREFLFRTLSVEPCILGVPIPAHLPRLAQPLQQIALYSKIFQPQQHIALHCRICGRGLLAYTCVATLFGVRAQVSFHGSIRIQRAIMKNEFKQSKHMKQLLDLAAWLAAGWLA